MRTHILCSITFAENRIVYEIMSKNVVETEGATNDVITWRVRVACWISKVTCTNGHEHAHAPVTHMHARTHRPICNAYCFPTITMVS
jgi:hypothetical protein